MRNVFVRKNMVMLSIVLYMFTLIGCGGNSNSIGSSNNSTATTQTSTAPQANTPTQAASTGAEQPVPIGNSQQASGSDIPDTQVFVTYKSPVAKYQLEIPEGWSQKSTGSDVSFANNLNAVQITVKNGATEPTVKSLNNDQPALQQSGRAVRDVQVQDAHLPGGPAVLIKYTSNSDPDAVTGKQVRQENNRYLFFKDGQLVTLTLSAPVGADNVDQWKRIASSFKWV